jgi:hypothetical protein
MHGQIVITSLASAILALELKRSLLKVVRMLASEQKHYLLAHRKIASQTPKAIPF